MESENIQNQRSSPVSYSAYAVDRIPEIDSMEENLAYAATVNINPSDRQAKAIQINEGSHSTELEAKGFEGKGEADEDAIDLISAPKLDCNEIGDNIFFLSEEFKQEEEHGEPVLQSKDEPVFHRLDSGFYSGGQFESFEASSEEDSQNQHSRFACPVNNQSSQSVKDAPVHDQSSQSMRDALVPNQSSQSVKDSSFHNQSSQSLMHGEMQDLVPSNTSNEETKCSQLPVAGDQVCKKNRKRKSDNVQSMKWHNTKNKENQKPRKKKPRNVNFFQECLKILQKVLRKSMLSKQVYNFFAFAKAKKYLNRFSEKFRPKNLKSNTTCEFVVCQVLLSGLDWTNHDMKVEWKRLYSFASLSNRFEKVSPISLATAGFYYRSEDIKIQCFTCNKCYSPEYLEDRLQACGTSVRLMDLHEDWCLISDHGNIPIHSDPSCNNIGNPSCNKRQFKDAEGKLVQYRNVCGLNTFFVDLKHILTEFPALKDALRNTKSGKAILEMLEHGKLNSARGIHHILLLLERKPEETIFNLENFELIKFLCELNEKEIEIKRSCRRNCQMERILTLEQIIINPPKTRDGSKNIIQQGIFEAFCPSNNCSECKETVRLTFRHPPPVLFLNVWRIRHLVGSAVPPVVHVLGHRYRIGAVYMHKDQHFTAWIYKPREGQEWTYYDDSNVSRHDQFSAVFDDAKIFPGEGSMVVISYYLADP